MSKVVQISAGGEAHPGGWPALPPTQIGSGPISGLLVPSGLLALRRFVGARVAGLILARGVGLSARLLSPLTPVRVGGGGLAGGGVGGRLGSLGLAGLGRRIRCGGCRGGCYGGGGGWQLGGERGAEYVDPHLVVGTRGGGEPAEGRVGGPLAVAVGARDPGPTQPGQAAASVGVGRVH